MTRYRLAFLAALIAFCVLVMFLTGSLDRPAAHVPHL